MAGLFVAGSAYQLTGNHLHGGYADMVTLTPGTYSLNGGKLSVHFSIVPAGGGSEWLVWNYQANPGDLLALASQYWSVSANGLNAAVPLNFVGTFRQFTHDGVPLTPTVDPAFGGALMTNPVTGGSDIGAGASFMGPTWVGPLVPLTDWSSPFGYAVGTLSGIDPALVTGYYQAFKFAPAIPVPEPATLASMLAGLAGLAWLQRRRGMAR